jgi:hypothetical protein
MNVTAALVHKFAPELQVPMDLDESPRAFWDRPIFAPLLVQVLCRPEFFTREELLHLAKRWLGLAEPDLAVMRTSEPGRLGLIECRRLQFERRTSDPLPEQFFFEAWQEVNDCFGPETALRCYRAAALVDSDGAQRIFEEALKDVC